MGSLPHFLTHGAPLRALRAREVRYNPNRFRICSLLHLNVAIPVMFKSSYLVKLPNKKKPEEFWQKQCNALFFLQYVLFIEVTFVKRPPLHTLVKSYWKSLFNTHLFQCWQWISLLKQQPRETIGNDMRSSFVDCTFLSLNN